MNFTWIYFVIFGVIALFSFAANLMLVAMSYAIASLRFENFGGNEKNLLSKRELKLVEDSQKVGAFASLGARFFLASECIATFFFACTFVDVLNVKFTTQNYVVLGIVVVLTLLFLHYVFCDLPAAALASRNPIKTLKKASRPFFIFYLFTYVFELFARKISEKIFGKFISDEEASFDHIDVLVKLKAEEEETSESLNPYTKKLVRNAIRLNELEISDVMIPRNAVKYLDIDNSLEENLETIRKYGHTRFPLCDKNLDNCLGFVHIKDFYKNLRDNSVDFSKIKRRIIKVKQDDDIMSALSRLRRNSMHMAIVEDEFGGIIGAITLECIIEELVGQIKVDSSDAQDESITNIGKNTFKISGLAPIHNVEDALDVDFDNDEVSTFGGLITLTLGRFPVENEVITLKDPNLKITIEKVEPRRILECIVTKAEP